MKKTNFIVITDKENNKKTAININEIELVYGTIANSTIIITKKTKIDCKEKFDEIMEKLGVL